MTERTEKARLAVENALSELIAAAAEEVGIQPPMLGDYIVAAVGSSYQDERVQDTVYHHSRMGMAPYRLEGLAIEVARRYDGDED